MHIPEDIKRQILEVSADRLVEVVSDYTPLRKMGASLVGKCPVCEAESGLTITPAKHLFKCFKCGNLSGTKPIDYLMGGHHMTYPEALETLAKKFCILIPEPKSIKPKKPAKVNVGKEREDLRGTFCSRMLAESGLDYKDIKADIVYSDENHTAAEVLPIRPGTVDQFGEIVKGDDVIIEYYDLEGMPIRYEQKDKNGRATGKIKDYFRVRWQFPHEHLDKEGKPFKYKSPGGSSTYIYIPDKIRRAYKQREPIDRLYIQEGEKKAEKACKHGLPSIGISGIQNLGYGGRLPEDLIRIIVECQVKEVCFILDADWNDLSASIRITDQVERRPRAFFSAVRNYKDYMRTLKNRDIYVEIYFGHVIRGERDDKGIDDLLANTLKGKEDELAKDIDTLINEKNLTGKYLQLFKITTWADHKLEECWSLNNPKAFAKTHLNDLKDLPEFRIGKHRWRINGAGELESAQPIESDEQFWEEIVTEDKFGNKKTSFQFLHMEAQRFLINRGFGRYRLLNGDYRYIHLTPPTVRTIEYWEVRDYMFEFSKANCKTKVSEMLIRGGTQLLGPDKLSFLEFVEPIFLPAERDLQYFYFEKRCWKISKDAISEIDYSALSQHIWYDQQRNINSKLMDPLFTISRDTDGHFTFTKSEAGSRCHFLQFLENTSNFTWEKDPQMVTESDRYENSVHLVAKLCAIGYMMMDCKDRSTAKAVVAMDGKQSEVGISNGRSGKSLVGELFKSVKPTVYIPGKKSDFSTDQFLWTEMTEKTKVVFIDDVRPGFDFELLFPNITGDWAVNYKSGGRMTFPFSISPKMYVTTNHALNGEGSSFKDRQWLIAFSDYYNDSRKPINDFGVMFFDEWDFEQWNLTWNMLSLCVQAYLRFGVVESPGERLEARILRQFMGEEFLSWADEYFSNDAHRNHKLARKDLYDAFLEYAPDQRKWCKPPLFKKRVQKYCEWKGYRFNPHKYDNRTGLPLFHDNDGKPLIDDKSAGCEYFIIGDADFLTKGDPDVLNQQLFDDEHANDTDPF